MEGEQNEEICGFIIFRLFFVADDLSDIRTDSLVWRED